MIVNMKRKLKNILTGIENIWKWRKVIYKDRNWDHWFIYEVLKTKLRFQAEYFHKHGMTESAGQYAKQMLECADLIDKVQNESYINEALDGLESRQWTDQMFKDACDKHDEARKQLFQLLETNIERWWD